MDMEKVFTGVELAEIKSIAKENGRGIADNSLRLMSISDEVKDVKQEIKSMSEIIHDMQGNVNELIELNNKQMEINNDMRATNKDIKVLLEQVMSLQKEARRDLDKILDKDNELERYRVGAM